MKKLKVIMPIAAFVFAIAFSFASVKLVDPEPGKFIQLNNPQACLSVDEPCEGEGTICTTDTSEIVYGLRDGTVCSQQLERAAP